MWMQSSGERNNCPPSPTCSLPPGSCCALSDVVYDAFRVENCAVPYLVELYDVTPNTAPVLPLTAESVETVCTALGDWQITQRDTGCGVENLLTAQINVTLRVCARDANGTRFCGLADLAIPVCGKVHVPGGAVMPFTLLASASVTATRGTYINNPAMMPMSNGSCPAVALSVTSIVVLYMTSKVPIIIPTLGVYQVPLLPIEEATSCDFGLPLFPDFQIRSRSSGSCACNTGHMQNCR